VPMMARTYRCVPTDIPTTREMNTKTVSRVSFRTFRNRIRASAPSKPNAVTMLFPMTNMTNETTTLMMTRDCVNDREYESPECVRE